MAAINFPSTPTIGEIFSAAGKEWEWDGTAWQLLNVESDGISKNTIDAKGDLIVGTASDTVARLGVGTDGQVLTASSGASGGLAWNTINGSSYQSASPAGPTIGQLWVDSDDNKIYVYSGTSWISLISSSPTDDDQNILANRVFS